MSPPTSLVGVVSISLTEAGVKLRNVTTVVDVVGLRGEAWLECDAHRQPQGTCGGKEII